MKSKRSFIDFPVTHEFLKLIADGSWHTKRSLRQRWLRIIPPEYFVRRHGPDGLQTVEVLTLVGIRNRLFCICAKGVLKSGYVIRRDLPELVRCEKNWECQITEKGMIRLRILNEKEKAR